METVRQKLECAPSIRIGLVGHVQDTPSSPTELLENIIMRYGLANHLHTLVKDVFDKHDLR